MSRMVESYLLDGSVEKTLVLDLVCSFMDLEREDVLNDPELLSLVEDTWVRDHIWYDLDEQVHEILEDGGYL